MATKSTENGTIGKRTPSKEIDHLFIKTAMKLAIESYDAVARRPRISKEEARRNVEAGIKRLAGHQFRQSELVHILMKNEGYISRKLKEFPWLRKEDWGVWSVIVEPHNLIEYYPEMKDELNMLQQRYWPSREPRGFQRWYWSGHVFKMTRGKTAESNVLKMASIININIELAGKDADRLFSELEKRKKQCLKKDRMMILKEALEATIAGTSSR